MNKLHYTLVVFILFLSTAYSQNYSREFGAISKEEIELKEYAKDKNAEALVLYDFGTSYFTRISDEFKVIFERTTRIKILSEAGIQWSNVEIPFYLDNDGCEKVYDIEAFAYNFENGEIRKTPLDLSNTYEEKINNNWTFKKFAIPNVKEGTIIEYKYSIISPYKFNLQDWNFQMKIPVVYSEYLVKMIPFYEYSYILQGAKKFDVYESYKDDTAAGQYGVSKPYADNSYYFQIYKFGMKDVPAFKDEEFITSINDYIIKLDFQLSAIHNPDGSKRTIITTWDELAKELSKNQDFGRYVKISENIASNLLNSDSIALKSEQEKFNYAIEYVKSNYNWNKINTKFASKTPRKLVEEKSGNSADINLFAIGLLNSVGIKAYPVVISTRDHGKIKYDYPFDHFFNYVIILAEVNGGILLSDATEISSLNTRIPKRCINDKGLIINKNKAEWIGLECLFMSSITTNTQMNIDDNGMIAANIIKQVTDNDALDYRNNYTDNIEIVKQHLVSNNYLLIDSTISIQNQFDNSKPYKLKYSLTTKSEIINNKMYISPFLNVFTFHNPLKQKERIYPIDMIYPQKKMYGSTIQIPDGYQIDFVPEGLKINTDLFELNYTVSVYDKLIQVLFDYSFKETVYQPTDYLLIKDFFDKIAKKINEKIVVKKLDLVSK